MNKQNEYSTSPLEQNEQIEGGSNSAKKLFIEPMVSVPVDVLEATTNFLFLTADSGFIP